MMTSVICGMLLYSVLSALSDIIEVAIQEYQIRAEVDSPPSQA